MENSKNSLEWCSLLEKLPIAALVYERETSKILTLNRAFIQLMGYNQTAFSDLSGFLATTCPNDAHRQRLMNAWIETVEVAKEEGHETEPLEVVLLTRCRQESFVRLQTVQEDTFVVVLLTDMNAYNEMESELKKASSTDYLTGLPNRKYFMDILVKQLDHSRRYKEDISMLMMNLDDFKVINEEYGWETGDRVILAVTETIQECVRACDMLSRIDGETFCVLLPATGDDGAVALAERIRQTISELDLSFEEGQIQMTISIGVAHAYKGMVAADQLLKRCENALGEAKLKGKDCIVTYQSQIII